MTQAETILKAVRDSVTPLVVFLIDGKLVFHRQRSAAVSRAFKFAGQCWVGSYARGTKLEDIQDDLNEHHAQQLEREIYKANVA